MHVLFIGQIMAVFLSVRNDVLVRRIVVPMYGNVRMLLRVLAPLAQVMLCLAA